MTAQFEFKFERISIKILLANNIYFSYCITILLIVIALINKNMDSTATWLDHLLQSEYIFWNTCDTIYLWYCGTWCLVVVGVIDAMWDMVPRSCWRHRCNVGYGASLLRLCSIRTALWISPHSDINYKYIYFLTVN